ncbi:Uncharacterised protein [uncultured archaeon]|nr:Uncharacterised protein [uncultured archaeon]
MNNSKKTDLEQIAGEFLVKAALSKQFSFSESVESLKDNNSELRDYLISRKYVEKTTDLHSPYKITKLGRGCGAEYSRKQRESKSD